MKRIIIICEGQTEQAFCKDVLQPYFGSNNILIQYPLIKKSGGGIVGWNSLKKEIETHLRTNEIIVSTFIDYYGLQEKHLFPDWQEAQKMIDKSQRMAKLEEAMKNDINESIRHRFIPYIQLHEFEGLLFNNLDVFKRNFNFEELMNTDILVETLKTFPNPELINDGKDTAPSKRLDSIIRGYNKVIHGAILAQDIGLPQIRSKCPRFDNWLSNLFLSVNKKDSE